MICPNDECPDWTLNRVRGEYEEGIERCPRCGTSLVVSLPAADARSFGAPPRPRSVETLGPTRPLRPVGNLNAFVRYLLIAYICATGAAMITSLVEYASYSAAGGAVDFSETVLPVDVAVIFVAFSQVVLLSLVAVVFLRWTYVTSANLHVAVPGRLETSPGWAVGWYFVPLLNLFRPYQAMREIWDVSHDERPGRAASAATRADHSLLGLWWFFWIVSMVAERVAFSISGGFGEPDDYAASALASFVSDGLGLVTAGFLLILVSRISRATVANHGFESRPVSTDQATHSGWGVASFMLGLFALGLWLVLLVFSVVSDVAVLPPFDIVVGLGIMATGLMGVAGAVLAIAGLSQLQHRRVWSSIGLGVNLFAVFVIAGVMTFAWTVPDVAPPTVPEGAALDATRITIGVNSLSPPTGTTRMWLALEVAAGDVGDYVIDVASTEGDLVAYLYDSADGRLLASDDDSGGDLNPKLVISLGAGSYLVEVVDYDAAPVRAATVNVTVEP